MSAKMESRQCTPSVIAKLMGLDEMSPHQPVHKKQRVLSEDYLRRVASVGIRGKRSSHERHGENKEFKDTFEVHEKLKWEYCNLPVEKGKFNLSLSAAKEVGDAWVVVDSKIDLFMKYLQESDSLITDHLCNLQGIPYHLQSGCLKFLKTSNASDTGMTDICSIYGRETDQESAKLLQKLETGLVTDTRGDTVRGNRYKLLESQKESDNILTKIVVLKPKLGKKENAARCFPPCSSCRDSHSIDMNHNSREKGNLYTEENERTNMNKDVEPARLRFRISGKFSRQTGQAKSNLFLKLSKPDSRDNITFGNESELKTFLSPNSSKNHKEKHSEKTDFKLLVEDGYFSSQFPYASNQQDMSVGIFKEDSAIDPKSLVNSEEAYHSSPNSVLKPFEKEILSSSACFQGVDVNLQDLQFQLELLKSDSSETYSEGDGMIVSSDDDFELGSVSNGGKSEQFMRTTSIEEGRDFSYLVDIFTEAGFHGRNSGTSYETWHSPECPISPAVFEMLEKKYGEQISWKRSERRLLFDQINSELKEILLPSIGSHWTKPLSTRLCFRKSLDMIEEELWTLLDHQKKQASEDSSGKLMGKDDGWLELGDDIEVIVREIEDSLIDQLAAEVVSMESF